MLNYGPKNYILAVKYKNFVFVHNVKCAGTFFLRNFKKNGWTQILYSDINWDTDIVFGHMLDPFTRRHKSIRESIVVNNLTDDFLSSVKLQNTFKYVTNVDLNGLPYVQMFENDYEKIHWLPLIDTNENNILKTEYFLEKHGYDKKIVWEYSTLLVNASSDKGILVEKILKRSWDNVIIYDNIKFDNSNVSKFLKTYIQESIWQEFYEQISTDSWPDCPKVNDFNTLPDYIKTEIAEDHASNKFDISADKTQIIFKEYESIVNGVVHEIKSVDDLKNYYQYGMSRICLSALEKDIELYCKVLEKDKNNEN